MKSQKPYTHRSRFAERVLALSTALLAAYQIAIGIEGRGQLPVALYTLAFGLILINALLWIVLENEFIEMRAIHAFCAIVPLSLTLGLSFEYQTAYWPLYLILWMIALMGALLTASRIPSAATGGLALVYAVSGAMMVILPVAESLRGLAPRRILWVACAGAILMFEGLRMSCRLCIRGLEETKAINMRSYLRLAFLISATTTLGFAA